MKLTTETKVGLLVVCAAVGFAWLSLQSGLVSGGGMGMRELSSSFSTVDGLTPGAKVKVAGVDVGEVYDITLSPNGSANVHMRVRSDVPLAANVQAQIASNGIIGDKFIALTTDFGAQGTLAGDVKEIPGTVVSSANNIADNFAKISADLEAVTASLRSAFGGEENAQQLSNIVNSVEKVGMRLDEILSSEIKPGQIGTITEGFASVAGSLKEDGPQIVEDVKAAAASLKNILADNQGDAKDMVANVGRAAKSIANIAERLERGEGTLGKLLQDDPNGSNMMADLQVAARDLRAITEKVNTGEGTIGRLINDPATADKIDTALDSFSGYAERLEQFRTEVDFNGYSLLAEDRVSKGNFTVTLSPRPTRFYVIGLNADGFAAEAGRVNNPNRAYRGQEFGAKTKYTMQFGHVYQDLIFDQDLAFRLGLKNSSFGVGADLDVPFWGYFVKLSADVYDFGGEYSGRGEDDPHVDIAAKLNLIDNNIYAMYGYDNVLSPRFGSAFVGIGFRFQDDDLKFLMGQAL